MINNNIKEVTCLNFSEGDFSKKETVRWHGFSFKTSEFRGLKLYDANSIQSYLDNLARTQSYDQILKRFNGVVVSGPSNSSNNNNGGNKNGGDSGGDKYRRDQARGSDRTKAGAESAQSAEFESQAAGFRAKGAKSATEELREKVEQQKLQREFNKLKNKNDMAGTSLFNRSPLGKALFNLTNSYTTNPVGEDGKRLVNPYSYKGENSDSFLSYAATNPQLGNVIGVGVQNLKSNASNAFFGTFGPPPTSKQTAKYRQKVEDINRRIAESRDKVQPVTSEVDSLYNNLKTDPRIRWNKSDIKDNNKAIREMTKASKTSPFKLYREYAKSELDKSLKPERKELNTYRKDIAKEYQDRLVRAQERDRQATEELADESNREIARLEKKRAKARAKLAEAESTDKARKVTSVVSGIGAAGSALKTAVSSKARDELLQREGKVGLERRSAQLGYMLGMRDDDTKIALGIYHGKNPLKRIAQANRKAELKRNISQYRNAQMRASRAPAVPSYYPYTPNMPLYAYSSPVGFSESKGLTKILNTDFSEPNAVEASLPEWKVKELQGLQGILNYDFESIDAKIAKERQGDMSEESKKPSDKEKDELKIDYDSQDDDPLKLVIEDSYYKAPEYEKKYQEMIARGFAEDENHSSNLYESFLNSCMNG